MIPLNQKALDSLSSLEKVLEIIPGASHLFEEPGALDQVTRLSARWFRLHLPAYAYQQDVAANE